MSEDVMKHFKVMIVTVCGMAIIASAIIGMTGYEVYIYNKAIDTAVENDYKFYYNGSTVNKDKLNIHDYTGTVNMKKHEVYLTDKQLVEKRYYRPIVVAPTVP